MAFTYYNDSYMCRCNYTTKLYQKPTDTIATFGAVLTVGDMFISDRSVVVGQMTLYQITSAVEGKSQDLPFGYWCPKEVLDMIPVEHTGSGSAQMTESDDSREIFDRVFIKASEVSLYKTKDASTPIIAQFKLGEMISVDREIVVNCNGERQIRYRISDNTDDNIYSGYWISASKGIQLESTIIQPVNARTRISTFNVMPLDDDEEDTDDEGTEDTGVEDNWQSEEDRLSKLGQFDQNDDMRLNDLANELEEIYGSYSANYSSTDTSLQNSPIGRMTFVHGMPFQYCYITDRRRNVSAQYGYLSEGTIRKNSDYDAYGHTFARNIAANMPIIVFVPGEPNYLTKQATGVTGTVFGGNSKMARLWNNFWSGLSSSEADSLVESIVELGGSYDYFTFEMDTTKYHYNVNALCQTSATLMGIRNVVMDNRGNKCGSYDWKKYNTDAAHDYNMFGEVLGLDGGVSFAYDPQSSISDTIGNSTTESQVISYFKSMSAAAREMAFISRQAGYGGTTFNMGEQVDASIGSILNSEEGSSLGAMGNRVKDFLINTAQGFNIRFPEIWDDSSHSRSYDIDMHFITPYATSFCKWRYVLVPFFMIFSMAAPRAEKNMSVYGAPNIIKAFSKGYFNVEIGLIESLTWKRYGDGEMISSDGVPTQIDVSVSFKDLYHVLTLSHTNGATAMAAFFNNTGLMDMLGTLSGVDMNRVGLPERISLYVGSAQNAILGLGANFMQHIQDRVANFLERQWFM